MHIFTFIFANGMKSGFLISLLLLVFPPPPAYSGRIAPSEPYTLTGYVIKIVDGDTYDILLADKTQKRIRMEGIDAPEKGMPFYRVSKDYLSSLCFNKTVNVQVTGNDGNRLIGFTYLEDGTELSHAMIAAGLAWHFIKYNADHGLARLETKARRKKIGLWSDKNPMPPWDNRALHRQGVSTKEMFNIQEDQR
jgi:micrococcal nuclease